ncbi:MAG: MGMT family protein [Thermoplasmata archaeon]|nr:MGMT family protein [Thermoplasmata archaeon]
MITYGEVARAAGFPGAAPLTVWALQRGQGLPWHRVVGAGGRICLLGDEGREQRLRLEIEGVTFRGDRVRMELHGWSPRPRRPPRALSCKPRKGGRGQPNGLTKAHQHRIKRAPRRRLAGVPGDGLERRSNDRKTREVGPATWLERLEVRVLTRYF